MPQRTGILYDNMHIPFRRAGFTVIELTLAIVLIGVVTTFGLKRFNTLRDSIAVNSAANDTESLFASARQLAISLSEGITIEIDTSSNRITVRSASSKILQETAPGEQHGVYLSANRNRVSYSQTGLMTGLANVSIILSKGVSADTITVSRLGRVKRL